MIVVLVVEEPHISLEYTECLMQKKLLYTVNVHV